MNTIEKLLSKIFDKTILSLGLMTNKISDSITSDLSDSKFRDECAMKAMQGICVNMGRNGYSDHKADAIAEKSYEIAEAMLKVREEVNYG
jgi:hypothetical protein